MDTKHTPLPWTLSRGFIGIVFGADGGTVSSCIEEKDAALIVHSVNLLPELVAGLRMARKQLVYWGDPAAVDTIDALLAKATS